MTGSYRVTEDVEVPFEDGPTIITREWEGETALPVSEYESVPSITEPSPDLDDDVVKSFIEQETGRRPEGALVNFYSARDEGRNTTIWSATFEIRDPPEEEVEVAMNSAIAAGNDMVELCPACEEPFDADNDEAVEGEGVLFCSLNCLNKELVQ